MNKIKKLNKIMSLAEELGDGYEDLWYLAEDKIPQILLEKEVDWNERFKDFKENLDFLWEEYAIAEDKELTPDAQKLKKRIRAFILYLTG